MTRFDYGLIVGAYLLITMPAGLLVGALMRHVGGSSFPTDEGTKRMGTWIGCTERVIILTFVLTSHYDAVGLLIAAKSILRVSDEQARKRTEYVLLGTLLSLAAAVALGEIVKQLLPALATAK